LLERWRLEHPHDTPPSSRQLVIPDDERAAIDRHLRELDRRGEDLTVLDRGSRNQLSTIRQSNGC
jgi:hypothetical protein